MQKVGQWMWNLIETIAYFCLNLFFRLLGKELTEETFAAFMQFVKFGIVGLSNTVISYVIYVLSLMIFRKYLDIPKIDYFLAQIIAFVLSVLWSFYWNNRMVFRLEEGEERSWWKALIKTYISYSFTGLFLNSLLLYLWVDLLHISAFIAPIINLLVSVPINFIINKFWAFKKSS